MPFLHNDAAPTLDDEQRAALQRHLDAALADPRFVGEVAEGAGAPDVRISDLETARGGDDVRISVPGTHTVARLRLDYGAVWAVAENLYRGEDLLRIVTTAGPGTVGPAQFAC